MERLISERQEQIYRLRHHDFACLETRVVAKLLGITAASVCRHMREMQKVAPQLFPILTKRQADIYHMFVNVGLEQKVIAEILSISENCVGVLIHRIKHKGMYVPRRCKHVLYMPKCHDHQIKLKF